MGRSDGLGSEDRAEGGGPREVRRHPFRTRVKIDEREKRNLETSAKNQRSSLNAIVKRAALEEVRKLGGGLPNVDDSVLSILPEARPDAIVYTTPIAGAKIVASPNGDDGWKGVTYHPEKTGSLFAWTTLDLNLSTWARSRKIVDAMLFVASRIDDDGTSHFRTPDGKMIVSASWANERWERGWITETGGKKRRQEWQRAGWLSSMEPGPLNCIVSLRQLLNMLCRALTVKNGGLSCKTPL